MMATIVVIILLYPEGYQDIYEEMDIVNWSFMMMVLIIYVVGK